MKSHEIPISWWLNSSCQFPNPSQHQQTKLAVFGNPASTASENMPRCMFARAWWLRWMFDGVISPCHFLVSEQHLSRSLSSDLTQFRCMKWENPEINRECVFVIFSEPWNVDKWSWNHVGQPFAEVTYTSPQSDTMRFYGNVHQCVENLFNFQGYICRMFQWIDCKCVTQSMNVHTN